MLVPSPSLQPPSVRRVQVAKISPSLGPPSTRYDSISMPTVQRVASWRASASRVTIHGESAQPRSSGEGSGALKSFVSSRLHRSPAWENLFTASACFSLTPLELAAFPTVSLLLGDNVTLSLPPHYYLRNGTAFCDGSDAGKYGLAIEDGGVNDGTIMGDTVMQPYLTVFDRANSRVGFVSSPPSFCGLK